MDQFKDDIVLRGGKIDSSATLEKITRNKCFPNKYILEFFYKELQPAHSGGPRTRVAGLPYVALSEEQIKGFLKANGLDDSSAKAESESKR